MTNSIKQLAGRSDEEGFTLIELMVVVLIIGILMAIAIPTFLGAKNSANARAAQSNLRNAVTAESTYFSGAGNQNYGNTAAIQPLETALAFHDLTTQAAPTLAANNVYIEGTPGTGVVLAAKGSDNKCYYVSDYQGQVSYFTDTTSGCTATPWTTAPTTTPPTASVSYTAAGGQWATAW